MKRTKKAGTAVLAGALAATLVIGGTFAYFTDGDTAVNTFTVGKGVAIDLQEPGFDENTEAVNIIPNQEITKDPKIVNTGSRDSYVFLQVKVPTANIITAAQDGTREEQTETQLFGYDADPNWTLVTNSSVSDAIPAGQTISAANRTGDFGEHIQASGEEAGYITYLYAYTGSDASTMEALAADAETPALFGAVRLVNAVEDQLENTSADITVTAYAIQADFINSGDTEIDGTNAPGQTEPAAVWKVLRTQAPAADDREGENTSTDI